MTGFDHDSCVGVWRMRMGSSWNVVRGDFKRFYDDALMSDPMFKGFSHSQLIKWQSEAAGRDRYRILELAQNWIDKQPLRYKTKTSKLSYIRSFFMHNRAGLPEDPSFRFKANAPPVEGKLDVESFRRGFSEVV